MSKKQQVSNLTAQLKGEVGSDDEDFFIVFDEAPERPQFDYDSDNEQVDELNDGPDESGLSKSAPMFTPMYILLPESLESSSSNSLPQHGYGIETIENNFKLSWGKSGDYFNPSSPLVVDSKGLSRVSKKGAG